MRAFVFTDERLRRDAGRFVWLAIDTENRTNAAFRKRYPVPALPSFLVIDPGDETVVMRWVGGANVAQLERVFDDAEAAYRGGSTGGGPETALARADRLYGEEKHAEAVAAYRQALAAAPPGWPSRTRCIESLLYSLSQLDSSEAIVALAHEVYPGLKGTPTGVSAVSSGLGAALALPDSAPHKREDMVEFEALLRTELRDASIPLSGDDRSSCLSMLIDARKAAGDSTGAHMAAQDWADFLERAAREARTPEQRAVYDPHRLSAYLELGQPERAVPMLQQTEKDFPDDYNPPARLAVAYQNMKRWDDALAASDRAMAKADGPRKLRFYQTRAEILVGKGDAAAAKKTLEEAIAYAGALPDGQGGDQWIPGLKKRLEKLTQTSASH